MVLPGLKTECRRNNSNFLNKSLAIVWKLLWNWSAGKWCQLLWFGDIKHIRLRGVAMYISDTIIEYRIINTSFANHTYHLWYWIGTRVRKHLQYFWTHFTRSYCSLNGRVCWTCVMLDSKGTQSGRRWLLDEGREKFSTNRKWIS